MSNERPGHLHFGQDQVDDLCCGAAFLAAGGGGPYIGGLIVKRQQQAGKTITLVDPEALADDDLVVPSAMMGASTVLLEKAPSGAEPIQPSATASLMFELPAR